jgi:Na+/melibiose symporter-like transporter
MKLLRGTNGMVARNYRLAVAVALSLVFSAATHASGVTPGASMSLDSMASSTVRQAQMVDPGLVVSAVLSVFGLLLALFVLLLLRTMLQYASHLNRVVPVAPGSSAEACNLDFQVAQRNQALLQLALSFLLNWILIAVGLMVIVVFATLACGGSQLMTPGGLPVPFACATAIVSWGFIRHRSDRRASLDQALDCQIGTIKNDTVRDELIVARVKAQIDRQARRKMF